MHGQKKRRKRSIESPVMIEGFALVWKLRSEPQASSEGHEGLSIGVARTDGAFRELILEYPFPRKGRHLRIDGKTYCAPPQFPIRPAISKTRIEADIRQAIATGWDPESRGKAFVFQVPEGTS